MGIVIKNSNGHSNFSESTLIWAVICSILLHVLLAVVLPNFKFETTENKQPQPLTIEIMQPTPLAPVVEPVPIKPEPVKKEIKPITEPVKPIQKKSPEPIPIQEANPEPTLAEPPPTVITATSKADATPVIVAYPGNNDQHYVNGVLHKIDQVLRPL